MIEKNQKNYIMRKYIQKKNKYQQDLEDLIIQKQEKEDNKEINLFKFENLLKEKDSIILQLKKN